MHVVKFETGEERFIAYGPTLNHMTVAEISDGVGETLGMTWPACYQRVNPTKVGEYGTTTLEELREEYGRGIRRQPRGGRNTPPSDRQASRPELLP